MNIKFYQNNNDRNVLNKKLVFVNEKNINVRNDVNIHEFDIIIDDTNCNYCYIDELKRYYFMDKTHANKTQSTFHLTCDVLMTFKDDLLKKSFNVVRSSNVFSGYLTDGKIQTYAYEQIVCKKFPNEMNNDSIILMTIG